MADEKKVYAVFAGRIQFDVEEKEVKGQTVRDFTIKDVTNQRRIRCTLWPDYADLAVNRGDFVLVEGQPSKYETEKDGNPVTYYNLSVSSIAVVPAAPRKPRETVNADSGADESDPF